MADLTWSSDDTVVVCWDNAIECRLLIYSATQGLLHKHEPYSDALGVKTGLFSVNGQYFVAGFCDGKARLYNHTSWKMIMDFDHKKAFTEEDDIHIYKEENFKEGGPYQYDASSSSRYKMMDLPFRFESSKPKKSDLDPASLSGVSKMCWSFDSKYLATKNEASPNVAYIWDMTTLKLHVILIHHSPIKSMSWSDCSIHLAISTCSPRIFIWSHGGASVCDIPVEGS